MNPETLKAALTYMTWHAPGRCNVCGNPTIFLCKDPRTARNNMICVVCRSYSRKRYVAQMMLALFWPTVPAISRIPRESQVQIYSTDSNDVFSRFLKDHPGFYASDLIPGMARGAAISARVSCQDLEQLTFEDERFDVVVTEDVFEHVREHLKGFQEVYRVLKPGGVHIFTVPFAFDQPTLVRVDTSGPEDVHLLPPEYHGDPIRGQILAYRTFGIDIFDTLHGLGFETKLYRSSYFDQRWGIFDSHVFVARKVGR